MLKFILLSIKEMNVCERKSLSDLPRNHSNMLQCFPGLNTFLSLVLSVYLRPLKLNNEFPVTHVCYGLKMAETLIIFIQILIISI